MNVRHKAREAALQALYFWQVGGSVPGVALQAVFDEHQREAGEDGDVRRFAAELVHGVAAATDALDARIASHSANWRIERLAIVDRQILRLAAWELEHAPDTPARVILDEAIELARAYGGDESARFVNGVLDPLARELRGKDL